MKFKIKYIFVILFINLHLLFEKCDAEKITYFSTERPTVVWYDHNCIKICTLLSRRINRNDPRHFVILYAETLVPMDNNVKMHFYFYQFLTNRYRPSFVEMHFGFCDMINHDVIFGAPLKKALGDRKCPLPPGIYDFRNLTIPFVPKGFPFTKGRIILNVTRYDGEKTKPIGDAIIDMELKEGIIKRA